MKLYELTGAYRDIQEAAENGEDVSSALAAITDSLEVKAERIACVLRNLAADEEALLAEVTRLDARLNAARAASKRLKDYVRDCMTSVGIERVKAPGFTLYLTTHEHVEIADLAAVPDEFKRTKVEVSADKKAILNAHKREGLCVEGTRIVANKSLVVR
jgi:hypothetical protein